MFEFGTVRQVTTALRARAPARAASAVAAKSKVDRRNPPLKKHICLITPGHLSTNPRTVKEADALAGAGYEVTVIAADYLPWAQETDKTFSARPWRRAQAVRFGPTAPLLTRIVQAVRIRLARRLVALGARGAPILQAAFHHAGPDLVAAARAVKADLYIAHYPAALAAAAISAAQHGAKYAFDAEDYHLGDNPDAPEYDGARRLVRQIEGTYLPGCAYVTAASPRVADGYAKAYPIRRPTVVLNTFPRSQGAAAATARGTAAPGPSIYWFSQTIGPNRGLEDLIRAAALAGAQPHLYFRGQPAAGYLDDLKALATGLGVADRLHFLPPAAPSEMERLAAAYDLGYSGEPGHTINNRVALGNKLFSYLLAGVPVLASDTPAHQDFSPDVSGALRIFRRDNPTELAREIDHFLADPETLKAAREESFKLGQARYNWDVEKENLLSCIRGALAQASPNAAVAGRNMTAERTRGPSVRPAQFSNSY